MHLEGQYERREDGYAMAVLLASIAILSVTWLLVMPVWKQAVQREKEAELIFRAGQYARGVALYQRRYANAFPPSVEVLLKEKLLRKKYLDPMTNRDFRLLSPLELQTAPGMTTTTPGLPGGGGRMPGGTPTSQPRNLPGGGGEGGGLPSQPGQRTSGFPESRMGANSPGGGPTGGIAAAVSRSTAQSIRVFKNRRQYNQWIVTVEDVMPRRNMGPQGQPGQPNPQSPQNPGLNPGPSPGGFPSRPGSSPSPSGGSPFPNRPSLP
jgi:type II secretory pathway pseudopilin PulG